MIIKRKISVIGLGYVGLPVATAFAQHTRVIGFDINTQRIDHLKKGIDNTHEVQADVLLKSNIVFTTNPVDLRDADFHIIAVPTPIDDANQPDLEPLFSASETVGKQLKHGDIVVYESTVYPGATEEDCVPILEKESGLKAGTDFFVGYSPERINPGDKEHSFTKIKKVVSGQTPEILDIVAQVYGAVVTAGIHKAPSIKVAEAAKVIENAQRDINIAFMNELSKIFHRMRIDTQEVLDAAQTKWNFAKYNPGLVGGHCIGVDPYYLTHKAQKYGYDPEVLLAGRRINDGMAKYVADQIIKIMIREKQLIKDAMVAVLGLTFKENCPDIRNSKVFDLIHELLEFEVNIDMHDPYANKNEVATKENHVLMDWETMKKNKYAVVVVAVGHTLYLKKPLPAHDILIDIKGIYDKSRSKFRL